jgi:hypothetical protein
MVVELIFLSLSHVVLIVDIKLCIQKIRAFMRICMNHEMLCNHEGR